MSDSRYALSTTALVALICQLVAAQDGRSLDVVGLCVAGVVAGALFLVIIGFSCIMIRSTYTERKNGGKKHKSRILAFATDTVSTARSRATSAGPGSSIMKESNYWAHRENFGKSREEKGGSIDFEEEEIVERRDGVVKKKDHTPHTPLAEDLAEHMLKRSQKRGSRLSRQSQVSSNRNGSTNQQGTPKKKKISDNSRKRKDKAPVGKNETVDNSAQIQNGDGNKTPPLAEPSQTRDPTNGVLKENHLPPETSAELQTGDPGELERNEVAPESPANHSPKPYHFKLPDNGGVYKVQVE